jgi:addiction module RelE/StbE family toxin
LKLNFTPQAHDDLAAIHNWIAQDNELAADRVIARIVQSAMMFGQFPMLGRIGTIEGTREFSVVGLPYLIVYWIEETVNEIDILTIIHTRQRYPPI